MEQPAYENPNMEEIPARFTTDRTSDFPWLTLAGIAVGLVTGFALTAVIDHLKK